MGYPCSRRKTKILWIFAPAKHRIKLGAGGRRWRRPSRLSVLSFICLSAVILHNYTLSNQKMREERERERGREQSSPPPSWQEREERRGEWRMARTRTLLRSQSRILGPLARRQRSPLSSPTVQSFCSKPNGQGVKACDVCNASVSIL